MYDTYDTYDTYKQYQLINISLTKPDLTDSYVMKQHTIYMQSYWG